jgi:hypothetical protein
MKRHATFLFFLALCLGIYAQDAPAKKGYNLGLLPAISYNTDEGIQYGAVVNLFNYGDGSHYPNYDQSYYLEASKYTKGSTVLRFYFDSEALIKGLRTFIDVSYLTDDMLDFYGYNGYQSRYTSSLKATNRAAYRFSQKRIRGILDLKGSLPLKHWYWTASYHAVRYRVGAVDYTALNANKDYPDLTPGQSLYEKYVEWGLIRPNEAKGGFLHAFKIGLMRDTRSALNNPERGACSEALLEIAPGGLNTMPYAQYSVLHRHYFSLLPQRLNLALRAGVQGQIGNNDVPFYRRSNLLSPFATRTSPTGLGGANSLRGILRNRIVGESFALGNAELRWKALQGRMFRQNMYLGINGFVDAGYVLKPIDWDLSGVPLTERATYFDPDAKEGVHTSVGIGIKLVMNENFIVSWEMGKAMDKRDGNQGTYINLNYLF